MTQAAMTLAEKFEDFVGFVGDLSPTCGKFNFTQHPVTGNPRANIRVAKSKMGPRRIQETLDQIKIDLENDGYVCYGAHCYGDAYWDKNGMRVSLYTDGTCYFMMDIEEIKN